jgi:hypothetical protein
MLYVGIDLHKRTITLCVVKQDRSIVAHKMLLCAALPAPISKRRQYKIVSRLPGPSDLSCRKCGSNIKGLSAGRRVIPGAGG